MGRRRCFWSKEKLRQVEAKRYWKEPVDLCGKFVITRERIYAMESVFASLTTICGLDGEHWREKTLGNE
jgi:hypothetical protein